MMAKKKETIPGVEYYTVGKGPSERTRYRITNLSSPEGYAAYQKLSFRPGENEFEMRIFPVEATAKRTLERAGLLTDPNAWHASPGNVGSLMDLAEARGIRLREREDFEWFAVEILINIRIARMFIAEGDAVQAAAFAVAVGELVGFARAKGYSAQTGKDGGSKEKKILPLVEWLRRTVKQYPEKPEPFFWGSIPNDDDHDDPQQIDGATMILEGDTLVVAYDDGHRRTLARKSFKRYIAFAQKSLKK
jgi:hypothetical protein